LFRCEADAFSCGQIEQRVSERPFRKLVASNIVVKKQIALSLRETMKAFVHFRSGPDSVQIPTAVSEGGGG